MKTKFGLGLQIAGAALAAALVSGGCAVTEPKVQGPVYLPIGSSWTSTQSNTGSYGKGRVTLSSKVTGDRDWQGRKVRVIEGSQTSVLLDSVSSNWVTLLSKGKPVLSWDPPIGWDYPLAVGNTWSTKHRLTIHAAKRTVPLEVKWNVEAYEEVTVPAGNFNTFRIRSTDNLGNDNVTWWSPEIGLFIKRIQTRTSKSRSGPGTRESELVSQTIRK